MKSAVLIAATCICLTANAAEAPSIETLANEVRAAETAFAKSMADRDLEAFAAHVADDAVFFGDKAARGKEAVVASWKPLFEGPKAPFSWEPVQVEVVDTGALAISSGPVRNPEGKQTGVYNSIWRREAEGVWKVVFDKGCPVCDCVQKKN